ncbi:MAG: hypothetical protein KGL35_01445 [Bradyrhizobium sp.]|uniref:hypothetical protein n=1 Tax=Bradyrhizobium sp. TaxID=376 RepID=UPI001C289B9D|nr:hypothetical protein [Bradyrhizobium sp.]MBU6464814.1 hypothetical protein [Pseudomonadota bacterium]MDE2069549.1 hypothetical protein [Bradyrhizobium sp.]MDE2467429.1 hypothetical protein [Bradyrhizobium sp.]
MEASICPDAPMNSTKVKLSKNISKATAPCSTIRTASTRCSIYRSTSAGDDAALLQKQPIVAFAPHRSGSAAKGRNRRLPIQ